MGDNADLWFVHLNFIPLKSWPLKYAYGASIKEIRRIHGWLRTTHGTDQQDTERTTIATLPGFPPSDTLACESASGT